VDEEIFLSQLNSRARSLDREFQYWVFSVIEAHASSSHGQSAVSSESTLDALNQNLLAVSSSNLQTEVISVAKDSDSPTGSCPDHGFFSTSREIKSQPGTVQNQSELLPRTNSWPGTRPSKSGLRGPSPASDMVATLLFPPLSAPVRKVYSATSLGSWDADQVLQENSVMPAKTMACTFEDNVEVPPPPRTHPAPIFRLHHTICNTSQYNPFLPFQSEPSG
jgi:hypothetical protein